MPKNYYIILGIPASSTQEDIKAAYKKLAKEYHPDRYSKGHSPFQNIQEAYSILSDPASRHDYDDKRRKKATRTLHRTRVDSLRSRSPQNIEPMIPETGSGGVENLAPRYTFQPYRASFDELVDRVFDNLNEEYSWQEEQPAPTTVTVSLTPDQAYRGGQVRIDIPVRLPCPSCRGSGGSGFYECWRCSGVGKMSGTCPVIINYPPGMGDNHNVWLSLDRYGLPEHYLCVNFIISGLI